MTEEFSAGFLWGMLRRRWPIILAAGLVTAALALGWDLYQQKMHRATVLLVADPAKYQWRLDYALQTTPEDLRLDRRSEFLTFVNLRGPGTALAKDVIATLGERLPASLRKPERLWRTIEASGDKGRTLRLSATAPSPALARELAMAWAETWIAEVEDRFGQTGDLAKFQAAQDKINRELAEARRDVQDVQARTGLNLELSGELVSSEEGRVEAALTRVQQLILFKNSAIAEYQVALDRVREVARRTEEVIASGTPPESLPLELLNLPLIAEREQLTPDRIAALAGDTEKLVALLRSEEASLARTLTALTAEADVLQAQLAAQIQERNVVMRRYGAVDDTEHILRRKVTELLLQDEIAGPTMEVLSEPDRVTPVWVIDLLLAGAAGVLGGIILAFAIDRARAPKGT